VNCLGLRWKFKTARVVLASDWRHHFILTIALAASNIAHLYLRHCKQTAGLNSCMSRSMLSSFQTFACVRTENRSHSCESEKLVDTQAIGCRSTAAMLASSADPFGYVVLIVSVLRG
jgi:hypothetical protein